VIQALQNTCPLVTSDSTSDRRWSAIFLAFRTLDPNSGYYWIPSAIRYFDPVISRLINFWVKADGPKAVSEKGRGMEVAFQSWFVWLFDLEFCLNDFAGKADWISKIRKISLYKSMHYFFREFPKNQVFFKAKKMPLIPPKSRCIFPTLLCSRIIAWNI